MKTSSVTVNVVIIVGCILLFMIPLPALLTYGSKQYSISEEGSNALCYVRSIFTHFVHVQHMHNFIGKLLSGHRNNFA